MFSSFFGLSKYWTPPHAFRSIHPRLLKVKFTALLSNTNQSGIFRKSLLQGAHEGLFEIKQYQSEISFTHCKSSIHGLKRFNSLDLENSITTFGYRLQQRRKENSYYNITDKLQ